MDAAIYARVSSDSQDVDLSISAQLRALRDYAAKHGHQIVKEYVDEAESGRTADRPAFREMISIAKTKHPPFESILVWKLNRFARSRVDSITYKKLLRDRGIKVISINEPLDDTPSGHLLEGVIETIDEFYSENLGQDIRRGIRETAERGFYPGGRAPLGYRKVKAHDGDKVRYKLEPEPEDSIAVETIRTIYNMAEKGLGCKQITAALNSGPFRASNGKPWSITTVHKVLTNEAYCGTLVWGGRPGYAAIRSGIPPVRVENAWPTIIDRETFNAVRETMAANAPECTHPRVAHSFYLLSGLLYCSCGRAMIGRSAKSHQHYYYVCNTGYKLGKAACSARSFPKEKLEGLIIDRVKESILSPRNLEELVLLTNEALDSRKGVLRDKLSAADAELADIKARLSRLYDVLETGKLNLDDLAPRIRELKARQDELLRMRVQIEADMAAEGVNHLDVEKIKSYAEDLYNLLEEADFVRSKAFLRSFVKRITINGARGKIKYCLPLPDGSRAQTFEVLPTITSSGPRLYLLSPPRTRPQIATAFASESRSVEASGPL
jgi:site-specific DNA recombinase